MELNRNYEINCLECNIKTKALRPSDKYCSRKCADRYNGQRKSKEKRRVYMQDWGKRQKDHRTEYHLQYTYGITNEQYNQLLAQQNGCCAICGKHYSECKKRLHVDHRHSGPNKGEITGLLCWKCNTMLIGKHHDPELFEKAARYLRQGTGWLVPKRSKRKVRKNTNTK